jgi:hypothetical protein
MKPHRYSAPLRVSVCVYACIFVSSFQVIVLAWFVCSISFLWPAFLNVNVGIRDCHHMERNLWTKFHNPVPMEAANKFSEYKCDLKIFRVLLDLKQNKYQAFFFFLPKLRRHGVSVKVSVYFVFYLYPCRWKWLFRSTWMLQIIRRDHGRIYIYIYIYIYICYKGNNCNAYSRKYSYMYRC